VNAADQRQQVVDALDAIKKTARDPYASFRSLYRQRRAAEVRATRADDRATIPVWFPQAQTGGGIDEMTECEERLMLSRRIFSAGVPRDVHRAGVSNGERPERVCWR
jgi:hypothetical protein